MTDKGNKIIQECFKSRVKELEAMKFIHKADKEKINEEIRLVESISDLHKTGLIEFK